MGYYTSFTISIEGSVSLQETDKIINDIEKISGYVLDRSDSVCYLYGKWYEMHHDIGQISLEYPHVLFKVEGVGEDPDDFWIKYIKGGKIQFAAGRKVFDEYNPSKMKPIMEYDKENKCR